jgi:hypothetical protein
MRWAAAQRAKPATERNRLALIKKRHARLLKREPALAPPDQSDLSDQSDAARDEAEADRRLGVTE